MELPWLFGSDKNILFLGILKRGQKGTSKRQKRVKTAHPPTFTRKGPFLGEQADIQAFILKRYPTPSSVRI
jgi:hypothetical protein